MIIVKRFDNNPANYATFGTWATMCSFNSVANALAFVNRAQSDTQRLRVEINWPKQDPISDPRDETNESNGGDTCRRCLPKQIDRRLRPTTGKS